MEFFPLDNRGSIPQNSTLLVPALSIGNVGQLAVDLIISSMKADKVGYLDDPNVLPCAGNDPYGSIDKGELTVALEVYEGPDHGLRIVQQRAPVIKGMMVKFAKNLAVWANNHNINDVIILSGLDASKQLRHDVKSGQIHYISTTTPDGSDEQCDRLGWKRFEHFLPSTDPWKLLESQSLQMNEDYEPFQVPMTDEMYFPSLPFASLFSCCKAQGFKVLCILYFCSEGDNIQDAIVVGDALQSLLLAKSTGYRPLKWVIPHSWETVYGPPPDQSMFC